MIDLKSKINQIVKQVDDWGKKKCFCIAWKCSWVSFGVGYSV